MPRQQDGNTTTKQDESSVCDNTRVQDYLENTSLSAVIQEYFLELCQTKELPDNPYPQLVRRFRLAETAEGLFHSLEEDMSETERIRKKVATSPELSGVTYVSKPEGVWGLPHLLEVVDNDSLDKLRTVIAASEESMCPSHQVSHGSDHAVNIWVGLVGSAVFGGTFFRSSWGDVDLTVAVEVVARKFETAVALFANAVLDDTHGCQGSNCLLLLHVVIDSSFSHQRGLHARSEVWTPQEIHQDPELFTSRIKVNLPLRPSITMQYLFITPPGTSSIVGDRVLLMQRHYSMHYRTGVKKVISFTTKPFGSLASGVFFSRSHAVGYAELQRAGGASFAKEGVLAAKETLARDVEKAREIGDTMAVHASLLPLALLSGINGDAMWAIHAAVDVARVTKSAAARHRALRHLSDSIREILGQLTSWVRSTDTIFVWESDDSDYDEVDTFDEEDSKTAIGSMKFKHKRSRSARDLFKNWLEAAHRLFWAWRRDVLMYLDANDHSDVMVVKDKVRAWITDISHPDTMGLRLPVLRWHGNRRAIADGKEEFLQSATATEQRLSSLSAWLHCLDLSLAWDAARICDRVHGLHLDKADIGDMGSELNPRSQTKDSKHNECTSPSAIGGKSLTLPTSTYLLHLQRVWLDEMAAAASNADDAVVEPKNGRRGKERTSKTKATGRKGVRHEPAPVTLDSMTAPEGLDVRLAIRQTLREDLVPEALAHEMTLIRYTTENRVDESLHAAITSLVTSTLSPNPFPSLTNILAPISTKQLLWRTADYEVAPGPPSPEAWRKKNVAEVDVCVAMGKCQTHRSVFGLRTALVGIDVDEILTLFDTLPPVQIWAQDVAKRWGKSNGGGEILIATVGIDGSVAPEVAVVVLCVFDYNVLETDDNVGEAFAHVVLHCAMEAQQTSPPLVVLNLEFKSSTAGNSAGFEKGVNRIFSPDEMLDEHEAVEKEVARARPNEIVLHALMERAMTGSGGNETSTWVPFTLRFVLFVEGGESYEGGSNLGENAQAIALYDCVYLTGEAAEGIARQISGLVESDFHHRQIQHLSFLAIRHADEMDYLEAYRLLLRLRRIRRFICYHHNGDKTVSTRLFDKANAREIASEIDSHSGGDGNGEIDVAVDAGLVRMLRGPVGRLHHARCMMEVLEKILSEAETLSEAERQSQLRDKKTLRQHAAYTVQYLLDCLTEQPPVRFEGAVASVKLRARLLLDEVIELTKINAAERQQQSSHGRTCRQRHAYGLCQDILSLLEIVHLAIQADVHQCCPAIEHVLEALRVQVKHNRQPYKGSRFHRETKLPPFL